LGVSVGAFAIPYASSLVFNPFVGAFVVLTGLAATLYFVTVNFSVFLTQDASYAFILQRLDYMFHLYDTLLVYEQNGIDLFMANMNNFSPESLRNFYLVFQELITVRESLFNALGNLLSTPEIEFLEGPILERANQILEDLRLGGNNLVGIIRILEDRLNIPEGERIPTF